MNTEGWSFIEYDSSICEMVIYKEKAGYKDQDFDNGVQWILFRVSDQSPNLEQISTRVIVPASV